MSHIQESIGTYPNISLPASIDLQIKSLESTIVFEKINFGEGKTGFRYGPNPTHFIAGSPTLPAQTYIAKIKINKINLSPNNLNVTPHFFVSQTPKTHCN